MEEPVQSLQLPDVDAAHRACLTWYETHARDLPWRRPGTTPWQVLVSEIMLQQTPVNRVLPVYAQWVERWPSPQALAREPSGEAVRAWGRLGYPRRALRLHAAARVITASHAGCVPADIADLEALPGVGEYTAAAVASFAYGHRHTVLDTNVRRVLCRLVGGAQHPARSVSAAERRLAEAVLPVNDVRSARWAAATMELGALVCTSAAPRCDECPLRTMCRWRLAGFPAHDGPPRRGQVFDGTDRQCRGRLLAVLREAQQPVPHADLAAAWPEVAQRERALDTLVGDGLVEPLDDKTYRLPGESENRPGPVGRPRRTTRGACQNPMVPGTSGGEA